MKQITDKILIGLVVVLLLGLGGCAKEPPDNIENICDIFKQYPDWYTAAASTEEKWGVPISVQMAIIHQESKFRAKARPPRTKLLWIIPWTRPTSAYGYSQALDETWDVYQRSRGISGASRTEFSDCSDFIGWYANEAKRRAGISPASALYLYLAYHEGVGGFIKRTYRKKSWLMPVAYKVQRKANLYQTQLSRCRGKLATKPWYKFW